MKVVSKIICEKVEFKNFLSYGNQWTTLDLREGVNAIIGMDEDKERSNGTGKCVRKNTEIEVEFESEHVRKLFLDFIK